jgi:hypothetical protein
MAPMDVRQVPFASHDVPLLTGGMAMKQLNVWIIVGLISVMAVMAGPAWACKAAGPNTHVGVITLLNAKERQFTIKDAETGKPMIFIADSKQIAALTVGDQVTVKYEKRDGAMVAKRIS